MRSLLCVDFYIFEITELEEKNKSFFNIFMFELKLYTRAVQTPVFLPPAPVPAPAKKTPAPAENFKLVCKFVKIGNFYSLKWKHHCNMHDARYCICKTRRIFSSGKTYS